MSTAIAILENPAASPRSDAEQLGAEITQLCSYIYAAESRLLTLIHEFDEKEYWAQLGLCSCAHWLNFKCGIGMGAARSSFTSPRTHRASRTVPTFTPRARRPRERPDELPVTAVSSPSGRTKTASHCQLADDPGRFRPQCAVHYALETKVVAFRAISTPVLSMDTT